MTEEDMLELAAARDRLRMRFEKAEDGKEIAELCLLEVKLEAMTRTEEGRP